MRSRKKGLIGISIFLCSFLVCGQAVYANSSWVWLTEQRPYELLPVAAALTIIIEVVVIKIFLKIENTKRLIGLVVIGNLASFALPYLMEYLEMRAWGYTDWAEIFDRGPFYIVGAIYLLLTLIVEIPIVSVGMKKEIAGRRRAILVIGMANVITTAMVGIAERLLCYGQW